MNALAGQWSLDPDVIYLNHGSFGACPRKVLDRQQLLRDEVERQPVLFFETRYYDLLDAARERLAAFVGASAEDLAPVANATTGVNTVLRCLDLKPGDEVLVTNHGYNACRNALDAVARASGAVVVVAEIPFPVEGPDQIVELVMETVTERTVFALLDHVTSATALVLPVEELSRRLESSGVSVMIDGAHAPGMLDFDLDRLGASWYTANGHKWICAPRGAAFLWARGDRRESLRPLVISHGANARREGRSLYHDEFDWVGTDDPTAFLSIPEALDTVAGMVEGGWPEVRRRNHALALEGRQVLLEVLRQERPAPDEMIGSIAALPLAERPAGEKGTDSLQLRLREEHGIEVPISSSPMSPRRALRISAQLYNEPEHYRALARALRDSV